MGYKKKTWQQKLEDSKNLPKILELEPSFPCYQALKKMGAKPRDSVVLAPGLEVNAVMKQVPKGRLLTLEKICKRLAKNHGVDYCCTLTTGIFINIVANAAEEMNTDVPYWRTIKNDGQLNKKFPGGVEKQKKLLEKEGHTIVKRGRKHIRYYIKDFDRKVISLSS
ncbi:MAG: MGMT family protein [Candidatus Bathyarchaeota archaeon]|nr:MAG: MGMT family protein [Candidatus Bathyarchaeota archaeon]